MFTTTKITKIVTIVLATTFLFIIFSNRVENNNNFDDYTNKSIKFLVNKAIKTQYKWINKNSIKNIVTYECYGNIEKNDNFYKKSYIYFIDKKYMSTLRELDNDTLTVSVHVSDFLGSYLQIIQFVNNANGGYYISSIEFDK